MASEKIHVLIVAGAATVRRALAEILAEDGDFAVAGIATDPYAAARRIHNEIPDVIVLDADTPRMGAITFLRKLMAQHPIPVVFCAPPTESGGELVREAREAGAVDIIVKPCTDVAEHLIKAKAGILDAIKAAACTRVSARPPDDAGQIAAPTRKLTADVMLPPRAVAIATVTETIVCIGVSTGGTESLRQVLEALPADAPGIVAVQHMPERFTASFARRLNDLCTMEVKEAADGDTISRGRVLIAPGGRHTMLERRGVRYRVAVRNGPPVSRHRPSADVLFRSAAHAAGSNAIGIIMTGMGDDGARGLMEMKLAGAFTLAQDEATSVVFGMPKEAIALGAADRVVPLGQIAREIMAAAAH